MSPNFRLVPKPTSRAGVVHFSVISSAMQTINVVRGCYANAEKKSSFPFAHKPNVKRRNLDAVFKRGHSFSTYAGRGEGGFSNCVRLSTGGRGGFGT